MVYLVNTCKVTLNLSLKKCFISFKPILKIEFLWNLFMRIQECNSNSPCYSTISMFLLNDSFRNRYEIDEKCKRM